MNRAQLIRLVSHRHHIPHRTAESLVKAVFAEILQALGMKDTVTISGFGSFAPRFKDTCTRRNPKRASLCLSVPGGR